MTPLLPLLVSEKDIQDFIRFSGIGAVHAGLRHPSEALCRIAESLDRALDTQVVELRGELIYSGKHPEETEFEPPHVTLQIAMGSFDEVIDTDIVANGQPVTILIIPGETK